MLENSVLRMLSLLSLLSLCAMELISFIFFLIVIIPSAIMHEYAHGWMADQLGDPTARYAGRLTLDPKAHVDKFGTILLPLFMLLWGFVTGSYFLFAYAKPVPYNPYNLKNQKWGPALVAAAGPLSNLVLAFVFGLTLQIFMKLGIGGSSFLGLIYIVVNINVLLAIFKLYLISVKLSPNLLGLCILKKDTLFGNTNNH